MTPDRLHVHVNAAMTADGKIDTAARKGATISSQADKQRCDRLRADMDAVLVGGRTLVSEDPRLTVKSARLREQRQQRGLDENPAKVGVVSLADLDPGGAFLTAGPARRLIYTTGRTPAEQIARLETAGAQVFVLGEKRVNLPGMMQSLQEQGIRTVMVEGGGTLIAALLRLGLVDEISIFVAPRIFGGASAPTPADGPGFSLQQAPRLRLVSAEKFDPDGGVLLRYTVQHK